jgi:hypothetical protein
VLKREKRETFLSFFLLVNFCCYYIGKKRFEKCIPRWRTTSARCLKLLPLRRREETRGKREASFSQIDYHPLVLGRSAARSLLLRRRRFQLRLLKKIIPRQG